MHKKNNTNKIVRTQDFTISLKVLWHLFTATKHYYIDDACDDVTPFFRFISCDFLSDV